MALSIAERIAAIAAAEAENEDKKLQDAIEKAKAVRLTATEPRKLSLDQIPRIAKRTTSQTAPPVSAFSDRGDRGSLAGRGVQKSTSGNKSPPTSTSTNSRDAPSIGPAWYRKLDRENTRNPRYASEDAKLTSLKDCIRSCKTNPSSDSTSDFNIIRDQIHSIAFLDVTGQLLKNHRMLHPASGLPQIFDVEHAGGVDWPFDIRADAEELYNKWWRGVFTTDIMRGLIGGQSAVKDRKGGLLTEATSTRIDPNYTGKVKADYIGQGKLVNGQWWPIWLAALRDGAHGSAMGGIFGDSEKGAYSCVLSEGKGYEDEDYGDELWYCGTDGKDGVMSEGTKELLISEKNQTPVRLLRSHEAGWKSKWAPKRGLRYDGLYLVAGHERVGHEFETRQRHRFRLRRVLGQDPIRFEGPEARPTKEELRAFYEDKRARGL